MLPCKNNQLNETHQDARNHKNSHPTPTTNTQSFRLYSILIAGPPSLNSAKLVFLACPFPSSLSILASFVHIHVEAYIFTLSNN